MTLEAVGVTQAVKLGPFQLRLKFGKQAYCVIELRKGEEAAESRRSCASSPTKLTSSLAMCGRYGRWSRRQRIEELLGIEPSGSR